MADTNGSRIVDNEASTAMAAGSGILKISNRAVSVEGIIVKRMGSSYPPWIIGAGNRACTKAGKGRTTIKSHGSLCKSAIARHAESICVLEKSPLKLNRDLIRHF
jgi:hypothetical protein